MEEPESGDLLAQVFEQEGIRLRTGSLSMLTLAVHAEIPVRRLSEMIYAYPTFHRAVSTAVEQLLTGD